MWECVTWYECHWSYGWYVGLAANAILVAAYLAIAYHILRNLRATGQWKKNPLARATGAIFFTCGVGHGILFLHLLFPTFGIEEASGLALRRAFNEWHMFLWPPITASAGVLYWSLRSRFPALVRGASIFEDVQQRQSEAMEIHDNVVQGIATAKLALERGQEERAREELDETLDQAKRIISDLMGPVGETESVEPGDLRRGYAAGDAH